MIGLKLAGTLSLLGAAVALSLARRRAGSRLLAVLAGWIAFLERLHHGVRASSLSVSSVLSQLDASERRVLLGGEAAQDVTAGELFSRGGALLGGQCAAALSDLWAALGQAADAVSAQSEIDRTLTRLREAYATSQAEQVRSERVAMALSVCGALGVALMLW